MEKCNKKTLIPSETSVSSERKLKNKHECKFHGNVIIGRFYECGSVAERTIGPPRRVSSAGRRRGGTIPCGAVQRPVVPSTMETGVGRWPRQVDVHQSGPKAGFGRPGPKSPGRPGFLLRRPDVCVFLLIIFFVRPKRRFFPPGAEGTRFIIPHENTSLNVLLSCLFSPETKNVFFFKPKAQP